MFIYTLLGALAHGLGWGEGEGQQIHGPQPLSQVGWEQVTSCVPPSPLLFQKKKKRSVHLAAICKLHLNNILLKTSFLWPTRPGGGVFGSLLTLFPLFTPRHTGFLPVPPTHQACCFLRAFALALPSVRTVCPEILVLTLSRPLVVTVTVLWKTEPRAWARLLVRY